MKQMLSLWVLFLATLPGCATTPAHGDVYRGVYFYNFETAAFTPHGSTERWCVNAAMLRQAEVPADAAPGGAWGTADVVVRGTLSPEGKYCNLGAYKYFLEITEVIGVGNKQHVTP